MASPDNSSPALPTPGPWRWEVNRTARAVQLCGGLPAGKFDIAQAREALARAEARP